MMNLFRWMIILMLTMSGFSVYAQSSPEDAPTPTPFPMRVVSVLELSPDSEMIALGTYFGQLRIYDTTTRNLVQTLQTGGRDIEDLEWSPDGSHIATLSYFADVDVWEIHSGIQIIGINVAQTSVSGYVSISWSPDGQHLAISGQDSGTFVHDAVTGAFVFYQSGDISSETWAPAPSLVTAGLVALRSWENGIVSEFPGFDMSQRPGTIAYKVAFSPDATSLAVLTTVFNDVVAGVYDITYELRIYNPINRSLISLAEIPNEAIPFRIMWSQDGALLAISNIEGLVYILDISSMSIIDEINIGYAYTAFDWLNNSEIVYATDDSVLHVAAIEGLEMSAD